MREEAQLDVAVINLASRSGQVSGPIFQAHRARCKCRVRSRSYLEFGICYDAANRSEFGVAKIW